MKQRKYTEEFKREAVRLVVEGGRSGNSVAKEIGISQTVLARWVRFSARNGSPSKAKSDLELENDRLKRELRQAQLETSFLRDAAAYFAKLKK